MLLTIGLEIHIKLNSENKMFCQCKNEQNFDTLEPNTNICPVCTGQPGALPTLSEDVLLLALKLGKALNCKINKESQFDRKSYFYPDLPMGYQITQLYKPTNTNGEVSFFVNNYEEEKKIRILDAHMESDTAKMIHEGGQSLIDFNRAGTPLIEIVTGPDFSNDDEVVEFLKELQRIVRYNNISNADMEKGQMRVDVNISIRKNESDPLGTRVELKNINSFGMIKRAILHEYNRQKTLLEKGEKVGQETRMRNDTEGISKMMRSKEDALDYRYFPEPDMPILQLNDEILKNLDNEKLIIPHNIIKKFKQEYGFHKEYINALIGDFDTLLVFSELKEQGLDPKNIAKWISGPINAYMKENFVGINDLPFNLKQLSEFIKISDEGKIMDNQMKIVMDEMLKTGKSASEIIKEKGFDAPEISENDLENIAKKVLENNPTIVEQYKSGKTSTLGFFVGQVMKETAGKANPKIVGEILEKLLK
ncbi:MAG TPA: Asp-tRNA(Asn)/Glu-tRNA(Gln) amidotransferase subunit GatB [Candidatus Absconditabacterales bacterium]|nr:Asp-tRNA(Asn)/Glu-tRNA(Gln) amidotransferase subunit GatB [Candidatus Absconditabacterales bacterium]HPK28110.1 Asp-tRNA(Asn)/Glu-tRNA(Gln) amidotransferase subunit GatB [Candidatus Absconditabacterales bacterium]